MGRKKIGLTSGLNPLRALKMKSCLIGVGAKLNLPVEVVESNVELPLDASAYSARRPQDYGSDCA